MPEEVLHLGYVDTFLIPCYSITQRSGIDSLFSFHNPELWNSPRALIGAHKDLL